MLNSFIPLFQVKEEGNWIDSVHGGLNGTNILHLKNKLILKKKLNLKK